jgi:hypothetical protein
MKMNEKQAVDCPDNTTLSWQRLRELSSLGVMPAADPRVEGFLGKIKTFFDVSFCVIATQSEQKEILVLGAENPEFSQAELCRLVDQGREFLMIEDASKDERLKKHPFVSGPPHIRFFASIPLTSGNQMFGSLSIADTVSKKLDTLDQQLFRQIAADLVDVFRVQKAYQQQRLHEDTVEKDGYDGYEQFLKMSRDFFQNSGSTAIYLQFMPETGKETEFGDEDLAVLSRNLRKRLDGIRFCKGTFGRSNVLVTIENSSLNGYGNAFMCAKAVSDTFEVGFLQKTVARIFYLSLKPFDTANLISVSNVFNKLVTNFKAESTNRIAIVSVQDKLVDFGRINEFLEEISREQPVFNRIRNILTREVAIEKIHVPYEFHFADNGSMKLTETESERLIKINLLLVENAINRLDKVSGSVAVDVIATSIISEKAQQKILGMVEKKAGNAGRLIISISGFTFGNHMLELGEFISRLKDRGVKIGFSTFSTMISHLPQFMVKNIDYSFIYTLQALDVVRYESDFNRVKLIVDEYRALEIEPVLMKVSSADQLSRLRATGAVLLEEIYRPDQ